MSLYYNKQIVQIVRFLGLWVRRSYLLTLNAVAMMHGINLYARIYMWIYV